MSYDVSVQIPACACCGRGEADALEGDGNYTSNMARAWRHAGADLAAFDGLPAMFLAVALKDALHDMETRRDWYAETFDAPNGWGNMATLLPYLRRIHDACWQHPHATVLVRR